MRKRLGDGSLDAWDTFWAAFQSALSEHHLATRSHTTRPSTASSRRSKMLSTVVVTVPEATVTVQTTIYSTALVTVSATERVFPSSSTGSNSSPSWSISSTPTSTPPTITASRHLQTPLPSIITQTVPISPPSISTTLSSTSAIAPMNTMTRDDSLPETQKRAIVGGLSGTIAGLVFIGLLIFVFLRKRRRRRELDGTESSADSLSEKGSRPVLARAWTGFTVRTSDKGSPSQAMEVTQALSPATVDEDRGIIRMNTEHWPRPYAPGEGEGWRESLPPGQLRVVNPDLSRPVTPRRPSETTPNFLKRQRPTLTGFVFGTNASSSDAPSFHHPLAQSEVPAITVIDPALSWECIVSSARTPSFRSYPSVASFPVTMQHSPTDSSVTPTTPMRVKSAAPEHQTESCQPGQSQRTSIQTPLQAAAGSADRTLSQTSHYLLYPPITKQNNNTMPVQNIRGIYHISYSTNASTKSRRSDPFDLDRASMRDVQALEPRTGNEFKAKSQNRNWNLYEGT